MSLRFWVIMLIISLAVMVGTCMLPHYRTLTFKVFTKTDEGWEHREVKEGWGLGFGTKPSPHELDNKEE